MMAKKWMIILIFFFPFLYFIYSIPFVNCLDLSKDLNVIGIGDNLAAPLSRSLIFSTLSSLLIVLVSLILSQGLSDIKLNSKKGLFLSLLLLPILTGNVSVAFIWKIILMDIPTVFDSSTNTFLTLGLLQFWQFGTFFIYLFWINQQLVREDVIQYSRVTKLDSFEKFRDIFLPGNFNLILLLFIIAFVFSFYEEAKINYIFRGSRGVGTELINGWLSRINQSDSQLNPAYGFSNLSNYSFIVILTAFVIMMISLIVKSKVLKIFISSKAELSFPNVKVKYQELTLFLFLIFTLLPYFIVLFKQNIKYAENLSLLFWPFVFCFFAGVFATIISIGLAILVRLYYKSIMDSFNKKSMLIIVFVFSLTFLPPILIFKLFFKWMAIIGYGSEQNVYLGWFFGHILTIAPILVAFAIVTHFRVKNNYIDYFSSQKFGNFKTILDLFLKPFKYDYLLLLIISISLVWNEGIINNVLSDKIPSFVTAINLSKEGKLGELSIAMNYFLLSFFLSFLGITIWNIISFNLANANNKKL